MKKILMFSLCIVMLTLSACSTSSSSCGFFVNWKDLENCKRVQADVERHG